MGTPTPTPHSQFPHPCCRRRPEIQSRNFPIIPAPFRIVCVVGIFRLSTVALAKEDGLKLPPRPKPSA